MLVKMAFALMFWCQQVNVDPALLILIRCIEWPAYRDFDLIDKLLRWPPQMSGKIF